jgi:hypothetical protein
MLLADVGDTGYNIILFLHILTMFAAFAPMFVNPLLDRQTQGDSSVRTAIFTGIAQRSMRIYGSMLILGGFLGFGVSGMSKGVDDEFVYSVSEGWLSLAVVAWIAMNGVLHGLIIPGEKAIGAGDDAAGKKAEIGAIAITALFLLTLYLMVFQPGH